MIIILTKTVTYLQHHIRKIRMKLQSQSLTRKLKIWFNLGTRTRQNDSVFLLLSLLLTHFVFVYLFSFPDIEYDGNPYSLSGAWQS